MSTLLGTMSIAMSGMEAQQAGLDTTTNNLANLNTPGYARERPLLQESDPVTIDGIGYGTGVSLQGIESLRDNIVELQINAETQQQGRSQSLVNGLTQVQSLFSSATSGIGEQMSNFFQSLNSLSTNPSDLTLQAAVLTAAQELASSFNTTANRLASQRSALDQNIQPIVSQVNQISEQIASINQKLSGTGAAAQNNASLLDQRSNLIQQLSGLIDVSVLNDG
jgi:flagellar hook-associated protein 1 FlgK